MSKDAGAITAAIARARLRELADPQRAAGLQRYFKTGAGEYGEGDVFLGVRVPDVRRLTRELRGLPLPEILELLHDEAHEQRLLALLLLAQAYASGTADERDRIFRLYLANTRWINSWDLVDTSAPHIVGRHLHGGDTALLDELAGSASPWERRIAMLATQYFIGRGDFEPTLRIADALLQDPHDLIQKAVGWMLREVGNRDREVEEAFLRPRYRSMPRTMLRYAIEKFPEPLRRDYLAGRV